jgi:hypothetical protein
MVFCPKRVFFSLNEYGSLTPLPYYGTRKIARENKYIYSLFGSISILKYIDPGLT